MLSCIFLIVEFFVSENVRFYHNNIYIRVQNNRLITEMKKISLILCLMLLAPLCFAQKVTLRGTVYATEDGLPIPGVTVLVKGTLSGTSADDNGFYSIDVEKGATLVFTFIGFADKEVLVKEGGLVDVYLDNDTLMLEEVVAVGYGVMKKSDLTGAVASVKGETLQKTPAAGLDQALQGVAAGVTVNSNSGQPGAGAEVRIRGIGTVNNSAPIYVVDGVIVDNINYLSPNDIASTEILKDASATAIYGSRGANGVILVTTRKGEGDGKVRLTFDAYLGLQTRWKKLDLMNADEFATFVATASGNPEQLTTLNEQGRDKWVRSYLLGKSKNYPKNLDYSSIDTDWQDVVFRPAVVQNYHVSADGGNKDGFWSMSANYFDQDGTIIGSDYARTSLRFNSAHKITEHIKVGENLTFMMSNGRNAMNNSSSAGASILSAAIAMAPWDPARYPDGALSPDGVDMSGRISAASNFKNVVNPLSMVEHTHPYDKTERWVGDIFLEVTPIKNLVWRSDVSLDLTNTRHKSFKDAYKYSDYDQTEMNFLESSMGRYSTVIVENTLTYNGEIGKHSYSAMLGTTTEEYNYETIGGSGANILNPRSTNWYISQTTEDRNPAGDSAGRTRRQAFLGRLHYSYDSRYMATLNFRADGSSKFKENTWGFFPSAALAWRISKESFMQDVQNLDDLKFRLGWGRIGNDKISENAFVLNMFNSGPTFVDYVFGQNPALANGATILTYVNNGGKWETTEQWNVGLDFGFYGNKLTGTIEAFSRDTYDMLLDVTAPAHVGNRYAAKANVGTVNNSGLELTLNYRNQVGELAYSIGGNASVIKNELTALNGGSKVWGYGNLTVCDEGLPLYTFWGYQYEGVDPETGDAIYTDFSGNGSIGEEDKIALGNPFPWLTYGINIGLEWKGFDFAMFFQGVYGNEIYNAMRLRTEGTGNESTLSTTMRNVWTESNHNGTIPNPFGSPLNSENSSRFVEDGSYLRLKNLQLGYTLPRRITDKCKIERLRVYLQANNLLTFTNYSGFDPEVGGGVDYGNYPQSRTFTVGVNLNF